MSNKDLNVLYIHPYSGHSWRRTVPMGLIGLMNSIAGPKLGKYDFEVTDSEIARSRIVAMDVHWFYSLAAGKILTERIKRVNPDAKIVLGGYTSSMFHRQLVDKWGVDYVVIGDADRPFPELISFLLNGKSGSLPSNVTSADVTGKLGYTVTPDDFDNMDFITIDWFPSLQQWIHKTQPGGYPHHVYPYLVLFRGCPYPCECMGNLTYQKALMGRGLAFRSGEAAAADLDRFDADPAMRYVYIYHDPLEFPQKGYTEKIFTKRRNVSLQYQLYSIPTPEQCEMILDCFPGTHFMFQPLLDNLRPFDLDKFAAVLEWARRRGQVRMTVFIALSGVRPSSRTVKKILSMRKIHPFLVYHHDWLPEVPLPHIKSEMMDTEFERFSAEAARFSKKHYRVSLALDWVMENFPGILNYSDSFFSTSSYYLHKLGFAGRWTPR